MLCGQCSNPQNFKVLTFPRYQMRHAELYGSPKINEWVNHRPATQKLRLLSRGRTNAITIIKWNAGRKKRKNKVCASAINWCRGYNYSLCVLKRKEAKAQFSFFCGYWPTPVLVLRVVIKEGNLEDKVIWFCNFLTAYIRSKRIPYIPSSNSRAARRMILSRTISESFFGLGFASWVFLTVRFWNHTEIYEEQIDGILRGDFWLSTKTHMDKCTSVCFWWKCWKC